VLSDHLDHSILLPGIQNRKVLLPSGNIPDTISSGGYSCAGPYSDLPALII